MPSTVSCSIAVLRWSLIFCVNLSRNLGLSFNHFSTFLTSSSSALGSEASAYISSAFFFLAPFGTNTKLPASSGSNALASSHNFLASS